VVKEKNGGVEKGRGSREGMKNEKQVSGTAVELT